MKTRLMSLMLVGAVLTLASACAKPDWIQQTLVTVDVTGTWRSTTGSFFEFILEQQGSRVTGSIRMLGVPPGGTVTGTIQGEVNGDVFKFQQTSGTYATFKGEMTVDGDEMTGAVQSQIGRGPVRLQRVSSKP